MTRPPDAPIPTSDGTAAPHRTAPVEGGDCAPPAGWQAAVMDVLPAQVALLDALGRIRAANAAWQAFARESGANAAATGVGDNYLAALSALAGRGNPGAAQAILGVRAVLAREVPRFEMDFLCHSGREAHWLLMQALSSGDDGGCVVSCQDITQRKLTEQSYAQLAAVLEATTDYVGMADEQGAMIYANRAFRHMRGLDLRAGTPLGRLRQIYPDRAYRAIEAEALPAAALKGDWAGETSVLDAEGQEIPVHQVILAHRDEAGEIDFFSTIMRNLTASQQQAAALRQAFEELKQTQEQLVNSEKMASIGQLTAGIAHEINNPVGYLTSNLSTLAQYVAEILRMLSTYESAMPAVTDAGVRAQVEQTRRETDLAFLLEDIPKPVSESREGAQRVRKIVQDLKDFAHAGHNEEWQWTDLRLSLERTLCIVNNELKYKAEVQRSYADLPEIRCLPGQLNQVFMNLLVNAGHAIQESGQVRVATQLVGDEVWIDISDTGCGMPPEVQARIFEPFFTTKPVGKGTGLGLSISYGIVHKHGGTIEVESEPGRGTTFRIKLPVAGPDEAST